MLGELSLPGTADARLVRWLARWHAHAQYVLAIASLMGVAVLAGIILTKTFFLGSDSANDYAHVWFVSDQIFHHGRLPLHIPTLESGDALTFPYAPAIWLAASVPYVVLGDRAVTATMILGFVVYGCTAVRARPALRDPRLLSLIYINTFLIEGLVAFQLAFIWACVFFFLYVEAVDNRRWPSATLWAMLAVTTHPFAGVAAISGYTIFAAARRPREVLPLATVTLVAALIVFPYAVYVYQTPAVGTTNHDDLVGTLKFMTRFRGSVVVLPLIVSAFAPALRAAFLPAFLALGLTFVYRIDHGKVNTFGLDRNSHPFYGEFLRSPEFDRSVTYRVLEPNDREDGAYQLMRHGAVLGQEFFDQSQFRRWWNSPEQYTCFLGAKHIDVVLLEKDYPLKFSQNESLRLSELEQQGKITVTYRDPHGRFTAYDVRAGRREGVKFKDCRL